MIRSLFQRRPVEIALGVVAVLNWLVVMDWVNFTDKQIAGTQTMLVVVLGLFIKSNTTTNAALNELADAPKDGGHVDAAVALALVALVVAVFVLFGARITR